MAELVTLARPYANAAFGHAKKAGTLADWSAALQVAAQVVADQKVQRLIDDPHVGGDQLCQLLFEVGGEQFSAPFQNFLRTMVENGRLSLLPEVSRLYQALFDQQENRVQVELISAYAVKNDQERNIAAALESRFGKSVELHTRIDKSLIGGAIIRVGDEVIDGSISGGLKQLATQLHSS